jgi:hypothetical protein
MTVDVVTVAVAVAVAGVVDEDRDDGGDEMEP